MSLMVKPMDKLQTRGFTLIELMIVLVIAVILLGIGVPSFRTLIQNQRLTTTVNDFLAGVNLARSEALQRGMLVSMVPVINDGSDWASGWIIFVDTDGDGRPSSTEPVIFTHDPAPTGLTITPKSGVAPYVISFKATGIFTQNANTMSFVLDGKKRCLTTSMLGRSRSYVPATDVTPCT